MDHTISIPRRRKLNWPHILLWTSGILLLLILLSAGIGLRWLRSKTTQSLPVLDGEIHLGSNISAPVTVRRDAHGVPHIQAENETDLFIAQGYITAQDRLWQMDLYRRNANGELSEILGPNLVRHDKTQRIYGFKNIAQRIYTGGALSPADRARIEAYATGVNLFIQQHKDALPAEFKLLAYQPKPWTAADSISIGLMMVQTLDTHWHAKYGRAAVSRKLHNPKLEEDLYPVGSWRDHAPTGILTDWSKPQPPPTPSASSDNSGDDDDAPMQSKILNIHPSVDLSALDLSTLDLAESPHCEGCTPGSNNWVISGAHTASGKPLLSNDMHLGLTEPNIWYMADLLAPTYHAAGVTLPGMPYIIAGHNEHVAWGFTALCADVQDLYIEKLDGKGNYLLTDSNGTVTWKPLTIDHQIIHVRGGRDESIDVASTSHGPLINPILDKNAEPTALKWTLYDSTIDALPLYNLNVAKNWDEFSHALSTWSWPTQNVVYADDQGHIAYHAIGKVPIRLAGLVGTPIADTKHEWSGYIPFTAMPNSYDPPSGFLATANSNVNSDNFPYPLTLEWVSPYRTERIYKALEGRNNLTPADMLTMQTDIYSEVDQELGHRIAFALDHSAGSDARLNKAAELLRNWDGRLTTDSAAASIVQQTRTALWQMILEPKLDKDVEKYQWEESIFAEEEIIMRANPAWLPSGYKNWDALLTDAVRHGMEKGNAPADITQWHYGSWHTIDIEHPLSAFLPMIGRSAGTGAQPYSGDTTTVKQAGTAFGPSQRFTMDWNNVDGSTENITLGESGNPYSPYFRDQWNDWYKGTTFALPFTQSAVQAATQHTLRLLPD